MICKFAMLITDLRIKLFLNDLFHDILTEPPGLQCLQKCNYEALCMIYEFDVTMWNCKLYVVLQNILRQARISYERDPPHLNETIPREGQTDTPNNGRDHWITTRQWVVFARIWNHENITVIPIFCSILHGSRVPRRLKLGIPVSWIFFTYFFQNGFQAS